MMIKGMRSFMSAVMLLVIAVAVQAQVTTASLSGKVTDASNETIIGATVQAIHEPSGTVYGAITNVDGRYSITNMRAGGPYKVEVSYVGYQSVVFKDINLQLGENLVLNPFLKESTELLDEVVVVASKESNMKSNRAGAVTNLSSERISSLPTVSRSMNDIMRLSPQSAVTSNGFAAGGGNYRQSYVTVDGAAFNNAFGIGSNLPAGGTPISLDALEQLSVSITPYDVRQSGFTGAAINAVTKSGTNEIKGSAYTYLTSSSLVGKHVGDDTLNLEDSHNYTYGFTLGAPIIKNKLFFFINGELEANQSAGPSAKTIDSEGSTGSISSQYHRPTSTQMNAISSYLKDKYGYETGPYQGYTLDNPAYKILARVDWNINKNNKLNVRFSTTHTKDSSSPSSSVSPMTASVIFPGGDGISSGQGASSNYGMYFKNTRYYQERNFTSLAAEWNAKWGIVNNALRFTYSYQDEPRSTDGGSMPTTYILEDGAVYAMFGTELFTEGNLRQVNTYVATDEASWTWGKHNLLGGLQFEANHAVNGYMQGGNGAYVFSSWDDFTSGKPASSFLITHANNANLDPFQSEMTQIQYSAYLQDMWNISDNFKLTAGLRFEVPVYPSLDNNYNEAFSKLDFGGRSFSTDQLPDARLTVSPRIGFNWDITGERKYILRGGTGVFTGRLPFVWLVSAVGNSNVGQVQYTANTSNYNKDYAVPGYYTDVNKILADLYPNGFNPSTPTAPSSPTVIDKSLRMPSTWKTSLAFDAKLPGDVDFTLEGIYNYDIKPVVISNANAYTETTSEIGVNDTRNAYKYYNSGKQAYLIENGKSGTYYASVTAQLHKAFNFGLDASFAYTYATARSYGDGIGDQVTSAYKTNTYSVNGINEHEKGYGTYVAPHRIIASLGYSKAYGKNFKSSVSLIYDGSPLGYISSYSYTRYSYTFDSNIVGDGGANNLLYIPASREELNQWNFVDYSATIGGQKTTYTADEQREDFWNFINQDSYLKNHKGQYAERGGAVMPWHHQFDFKFNQDFYLKVNGKKNTLQFGVDIQNIGNLLNKNWGLYKQVNTMSPIKYSNGTYKLNTVNGDRLKSTYTNYLSTSSTSKVLFSLRYLFN
jgi:hypothetical protein